MISSSSGTVFRANERGFDPGSESSYDGVKIDVYALPNSHCKGALLMMVDNEYAFIGDSGYCLEKDGRSRYNAQLLKAEIELLEQIPADKLLISHDKKYIRADGNDLEPENTGLALYISYSTVRNDCKQRHLK